VVIKQTGINRIECSIDQESCPKNSFCSYNGYCVCDQHFSGDDCEFNMRIGQGGYIFTNESKITPIKAIGIGSVFTAIYLLVLFLSMFFCSYLFVYRGKGVSICEHAAELKEDFKIVFCCKNAKIRQVHLFNR